MKKKERPLTYVELMMAAENSGDRKTSIRLIREATKIREQLKAS